ncbi:MAG: hypothetical protein ACLPZY_01395 [Terracidiphilus sp.]
MAAPAFVAHFGSQSPQTTTREQPANALRKSGIAPVTWHPGIKKSHAGSQSLQLRGFQLADIGCAAFANAHRLIHCFSDTSGCERVFFRQGKESLHTPAMPR